MSAGQQGRFVWYDLMSTDSDKAHAFYGALFGWGIETYDMGKLGGYPMFTVNGQPFGGSMPLPAEAQAQGAPSHWLGYVAVDDVDAAVARATRLGAEVLNPAADIPEVGRFAVLRDPQGGVISPFKSVNPAQPAAEAEPGLGETCWHEFMATDLEGALAFYGELFGWTRGEAIDMGADGPYQMFKAGDKVIGGMMKVPVRAPEVPAHWLQYTVVASADRAAEQVRELGGQVLHVTDVPGGRVAIALDPTGAVFGVWSA